MPGLQIEHRQSQSLSPRLQHAVRLLQMSSLEFGTMVRDALGKNPFLEAVDDESDDAGGVPFHALSDARTGDEPDDASITVAAAGLNLDADAARAQDGAFERDEDRYSGSESWTPGSHAGTRSGEGSAFTVLDLIPVETPLNAHLHAQLNLLHLPWRELALARAVVESLDDDGYLRSALAELLDIAVLETPATLAEMQIALTCVQSLDPPGVGARGVAECLLLQLPAVDGADTRALAHTILSQHLQALAARDVHGLARCLNVPVARVEAVCERIRRLDPRPGWRLGSSRLDYVVPDVLVKKLRGHRCARVAAILRCFNRRSTRRADRFGAVSTAGFTNGCQTGHSLHARRQRRREGTGCRGRHRPDRNVPGTGPTHAVAGHLAALPPPQGAHGRRVGHQPEDALQPLEGVRGG